MIGKVIILLKSVLQCRYIPGMLKRLELLEQNLYYETGAYADMVPKVMTLEETLKMILEAHISICRFGDGEFDLISGGNMIFQKFNVDMKDRLRMVIEKQIPNCLVCVPPVFGSLADFVLEEQRAWRTIVNRWRQPISTLLGTKVQYGNAFISRPYLRYRDRQVGKRVFDLWKDIFMNRNLLVVEGRYSRLGIGNDLFSGARSVRRIWCPQTNAFSCYDRILTVVEKNAEEDDLILLALGGVATLMAVDLTKKGFQSIDVGHLDIEYMWLKAGATGKQPIPGRYVAECATKLTDLHPEDGEICVADLSRLVS